MYDFITALSLAVLVSMPGVISLGLYWRWRVNDDEIHDDTPTILHTLYGTVDDLSRRMREMETQRSADYKRIMELSQRVESWREYSRVLVGLLKGTGVIDIPPSPSDEVGSELLSDVNRAELQQRIARLFNSAEIDDLAFQLGIEPDDLSGTVRVQRATSLVQSAEDIGKLIELSRLVSIRRPNGG